MLVYKHFGVASSETSPIGFHEMKGGEFGAFSDRQHNSIKVILKNDGHKESLNLGDLGISSSQGSQLNQSTFPM